MHAVQAALDACARAAALVSALADIRGAAAAVARDGWQGPARDRFDADVVRLDAEAAGLLTDLARTAAAIEEAAAAAALGAHRLDAGR